MKRWGARLVIIIKHLPHTVFSCETITRRVVNQSESSTFSLLGKTDLLDTNPVFECLRDISRFQDLYLGRTNTAIFSSDLRSIQYAAGFMFKISAARSNMFAVMMTVTIFHEKIELFKQKIESG